MTDIFKPTGLWLTYFLFVFGLVFSGQINAVQKNIGLPTGLCADKKYACDIETQKKWAQFQDARGLRSDSPHYISIGACSKNGKANSGVSILLGLVNLADQIYFDAKISFHRRFDKNSNINSSHIFEIFPDILASRNRMQSSKSHAYIGYSDSSSTRYWLRYHSQTKTLLVVVYFSASSTFICRL